MQDRDQPALNHRPKVRFLSILAAAMLTPTLASCTYSRDLPIAGCVVGEGPARPGETNSRSITVDVGTSRPMMFVARGSITPEVDSLYNIGEGVEITLTGSSGYWKDREEAIQIAQARLDMLQGNQILPLSDPHSGSLHPDATYTIEPVERPQCHLSATNTAFELNQ